MKTWIAVVWLVPMTFAGCTALSLERHTANQAMTAADMRYQLVLNTLARIAANPGTLPGVGIVTDGTVTLTDQANIDVKTALDGLKGFTGEAISGGASRSPNLQWTIDTAHIPDQIRAVQAACVWALSGNPPNDKDVAKLLKLFQVYDDLVCLNVQYPGWFCTGCKADVPKHCCYVAQYCDHYFWVAPGGLKGLSEFTLILADIATISPPSLLGIATLNLTQPPQSPSKKDNSDFCPNAKPETDPKPDAASNADITSKSDTSTKQDPLTSLNIPFRYNEDDVTRIDFLNPVVIYGVPNTTHFKMSWPEGWCGTTERMVGTAAQTQQHSLQPSGPNPAHSYRLQQQQQQTETKNWLSR